MNIFTKIGAWIKKHVVVTIIIGIVVVGGIATLLFFLNNNSSNQNSNGSSNNNSSNDNLSNEKVDSDVLADGTYSCELMYNGKRLDTDAKIKAYFKQFFSKMGETVDVDKQIDELRQTVDSYKQYYIVKDNDIVKLMETKGDTTRGWFSYDIVNNKIIPASENSISTNEEVLQLIQKSMTMKQTKNSFVFENYLITLTAYAPMFISNSIDYEIAEKIENELSNIGNLGDLVCGDSL